MKRFWERFSVCRFQGRFVLGVVFLFGVFVGFGGQKLWQSELGFYYLFVRLFMFFLAFFYPN